MVSQCPARVFVVRESQGEKVLFHFGQGKSGKLTMVSGEIAFSCWRSKKEFNFSSSKKYLYFLV